MKTLLPMLGRLTLTAVAVTIAAVIGWQLWVYYMEEPWTRDGRVRADVVGVAPDVSGLVSEVLVHENQSVHKGDLLLRIDRARFALALQQADAAAASRRAALDEAIRERDRYASLSSIAVSQQKQQQMDAAAKAAEAGYQEALADRAIAKLNLDRTAVTAPVSGTITNFTLRPGDYVPAGKAVAALIDSDTFHVDGYFEETKLARIGIGDRVVVHLMGEPRSIYGHIESIAAGIEDRERGAGSNLLPDVNPTFSWVRLAQRVPVRVELDAVPPKIRLVAGRTATVVVQPPMPVVTSPDSTSARRLPFHG